MISNTIRLGLKETANKLQCSREWLWKLRKRELVKFRYDPVTGRAYTTLPAIHRYLRKAGKTNIAAPANSNSNGSGGQQ